MEKKKLWVLRPVAWICTIVLMLGMQFVAELICGLGEYLILWLSDLSTVVIVILALLFGSAFCGLFFYSAIILPSLLISISDKIYPSNHAFRYYFVGLYEIAGCVLLIIAAANGIVSGGSMFWFYARYGWLILASIIMMTTGRSEAKERERVAAVSDKPKEADHEQKQKLRDEIAELKAELGEQDETYITNKRILEEAFSDRELAQMAAAGEFPADRVGEYIQKRNALEVYIRHYPEVRKMTVELIGNLTKELAELECQE